jgi:hypothetical protein
MFDLHEIATDTVKETDGVWREAGNGLRLKIARWNNPKYVRRINELQKPYQAQVRAGTLSDEKKAEIAAQAMSETILLDWDGMYAGGEPLPYSRQGAAAILADPRYQSFFTIVMSFAQDEAAYRVEEVRTELGESLDITSGGSNGATANGP